MAYENLLMEIEGGIGLLKINRPKALNAINEGVLQELIRVMHEINDNDDIGVVILTGEGGKAFVAGADISGMKGMTALGAKKFVDLGHHAMHMVESCNKPVIAAVNGFCLGGGMELALACDFIYASEGAKLGLPEVSLGIFPGFGGTQRLSRLIGKNRAKELIYTARLVEAHEAKALGIVNEVVPSGELIDRVKKVAGEILSKGPIGVSLAKQVINQGSDLDLASGLALEKGAFPLIFSTEDQEEGVTAFLEKRKANFKGR